MDVEKIAAEVQALPLGRSVLVQDDGLADALRRRGFEVIKEDGHIRVSIADLGFLSAV